MKISKNNIKRINGLMSTIRSAKLMAEDFSDRACEADISRAESYRLESRAAHWAIRCHQTAIDLYEETGIEFESIELSRGMLELMEDRLSRITAILEREAA